MGGAEGTTLLGGTEGGQTTATPGGSQAQGGTTSEGGNDASRAGGGQSQSPGWRAAVKGEVRDHALLKEVKDVNDLATRYIDLNQRAANAIQKPGDKATKEELDAYYAALGRPQSKDGYKLDATVLPEAVREDKDLEGWIRETLFDAGASQAQANLFVERLGKRLTAGLEQTRQERERARETMRKTTEEAITKDFGQEAAPRLTAAVKARDAVSGIIFGDPHWLQREMNSSGDGNKLWVIKVFDFIAQRISPDSIRRGAPPEGAPATPDKTLHYSALSSWLGSSASG
jgi:hypothetical protein